MPSNTRKLWDAQNRHPGDRLRLFRAVRPVVAGDTALYPGSFVDVSLSAVLSAVTYVDIDRRTPRFFGDEAGVRSIITEMGGPEGFVFSFINGDYGGDLGLEDRSFDLLVSLYAGFVSEHCTRYLRVGGVLLANPSHGDVAMASIDPRLELTGVVEARSGEYRVRNDDLDKYLVPKKPIEITPELLHERGRGIAYTRSPFAYLFTRVG